MECLPIATGGERFGGKGNGKSRGSGGVGAKLAKNTLGILDGEDRSVIDGREEGALIFAASDTRSSADRFGTRGGLDRGHKCAIGVGVSSEFESKGWMCTQVGDGDISFLGERGQDESKGGNGSRSEFGREWCAVLSPMEMLDVGWYFGLGEIIHTLVKASVVGDFDTVRGDVVPKNVLEGVREVAKENAFADVVAEFGRTATRGADPDTTTKRSEISEVGF